ncbi:uncharacterized protein E0L32_002767 [Thyridium curvatum]|uniref:N-acetyltransferase domain-containing protein n=1 Tax=Thyridium curvatum TaxID=1093900 RepID=A0A507BN91_9PEZI|nr:uncharacterized protein E0L32_002767 [Thyridium curvatum]TPX18258.1 hypothetical protein E0L32_002767 [Thyridium curvatum]
MPAIMDDPESPTIYRVSGEPPFPDPANPSLPPMILPRQVTLRDRQTVATLVPFASRTQVPMSLLLYLSDQFKKEVEGGDTYPMIEPMPFEKFASYWFQNFGAIMLLGSIDDPAEVVEGKDWGQECLGSFYIKPNYPGRSSHVCNAGFLVTDAARNRGVGRLMGEAYIDWAPKLGYTYSVFNLVYETNVASCKIWDGLGFKRIGRVKGCGNLKSYPGRLIDAIIYGRDLVPSGEGGDGEELVSEERFDKIRFYLKYSRYPNGADRAEKSRLRSAATHYKLLEGDKLMLKDKEVISDPRRQYDIAREVHVLQHGGINKTTATIAEKFHWSRIKETVSDVIRNCAECKELGKAPVPAAAAAANTVVSRRGNGTPTGSAAVGGTGSTPSPAPPPTVDSAARGVSAAGRRLELRDHHHHHPTLPAFSVSSTSYADPSDMTVMSPGQTLHTPTESPLPQHATLPGHSLMLQDSSPHQGMHQHHHPQQHRQQHSHPQHQHQHQHHALADQHHHSVYQPIDPQIISDPSSHVVHHHHHHHHDDPFGTFSHAHDVAAEDADADTDTFQALLNATGDDDVDVVVDVDVGVGVGVVGEEHHRHHRTPDADADEQAAMDRELDMLIEAQDDEDDDNEDVDVGPGGGATAGHHDHDRGQRHEPRKHGHGPQHADGGGGDGTMEVDGEGGKGAVSEDSDARSLPGKDQTLYDVGFGGRG